MMERGITPWIIKLHLKCFALYIDGISIQMWLCLLSINLSVFVALNLKNNRQNVPFVLKLATPQQLLEWKLAAP